MIRAFSNADKVGEVVMSRFSASLRVISPKHLLTPLVTSIETMGLIYTLRKRDYFDRYDPYEIEMYVFVIDLAKWERPGVYPGDDRGAILTDQIKQLTNVANLLNELSPLLSHINGPQISKSLYISTIRKEDQGGFEIPHDLVTAVASCGLSIEISIMVLLDEK
jgi:hypothetical protein